MQTAAVLPADVDAVVSSDATEIERDQAEALLADIDADYLVLITGNEADLDRIPLNDQLTADHAHQFGLAFHELLHILKTAISGIGDLIEANVESQFHEQVHDLINLIEDGAIESEAIHGDNFSDNAGIRLELTRRLHSQTPEELPADKCLKYSFWDAVTGYLYDRAIFETGTIDCLLNPKDTRLEFLTEVDRDAFLNVRKQLDEMVDSALKIRSASREDTDHGHDKTASLRRARVVIDTWNNAIEPLLEVDDEPKQTSTEDGATAPEVDNSAARGAEATHESQNGDRDADSSRNEGGLSDSLTTEPAGDQDENFDTDVTLDRQTTETSGQDIFEQPLITPEPDSTTPGRLDPSGGGGGIEPETASASNSSPSQRSPERPSDNLDNMDDPSYQDTAGDRTEDETVEPQTKAQAIAQATERARETQQADDGHHGQDAVDDGDDKLESTASQLTLDTFERDRQQTPGNNPNSEVEESAGDAEGGSTNLPSPDLQGSISSPDAESNRDGAEMGQSGGVDSMAPELPSVAEIPSGPAHGQQEDSSSRGDTETFETALSQDKRAAHGEATRNGIDEEALEIEFEALADQFARETGEEQEKSSAPLEQDEGSAGGPGSLEELNVLPVGGTPVPRNEWADVEKSAERVGDTLDMYLRLDRRKSVRRGLTAGAYDTRAGHRLAIGDPRVCKSRTLGNEKQYSLVLILDRSGSMRRGTPAKIDVATKAVARFAVAAEGLGINVAIVDFIDNEARLAKPFSVDSRHVQATLLDTSCGGGTPLADAISLGNQLVETQRDEPLIITMTDGLPSDSDDVKVQIRDSIAPVCSLTLATDCTPGSPPARAEELAPYFERESVIYSAERLDDRLEQFASLLAGF
ncbi:VWA domain-containing protein [Haloarcula onubensis]|uniref:VWA domain-containing protein n=1 Tax=Haloarcula onubensis TaxID=2950539 RepID=A0ABU2FSW6_9EURY|nr:VWA domain-containing protein [Halomicroarcula sp. S3CR25-11]MDS0283840.1 VWA domain-containing protein [Halomicroarcula sp. S3CR25-11]